MGPAGERSSSETARAGGSGPGGSQAGEPAVLLLPGDGIGPEVVEAARRVLEAAAHAHGLRIRFDEVLIGGAAIDQAGDPLPEATLEKARRARAVLLGAVGGPAWDDLPVDRRPEKGLLRLRQALGLFANIRPLPGFVAAYGRSPLKPELLRGVDLVVVRELTGGLYYGPRARRALEEGGEEAYDTLLYRTHEIERVARVAFDLARTRRPVGQRRVASIDKANVLTSSQLWRETVRRVAADYPDVTLEHLYVDNAAMQLVRDPGRFDVLLTGNLFGDILSDEAAALAGSLGVLPSASLGGPVPLFEPVHGSAPDLAGRGVANPVGTILSAALLFRYALGHEAAAAMIERAVEQALADGARTADLAGEGEGALATEEMTAAILERLRV
ncbi:3-isopropylmalate dehydrogenase [Limnochorda pilosa]|uniref:3-isopropylmalate dehydrogenase n=1 Tax=Limnochorda pilosa TaxID=1555112 RepID=A0A0K2SJ49_LIMPI|nr:3-isopropylmalate dehydrogenase [Limnochorda pilosa]BAS27115.1 3-isopropylmalate dehydrogenase [Limnochorda pilosa]